MHDVPLDRRRMLAGTAANVATIAVTGWNFATFASHASTTGYEEYRSADGSFSLRYPRDFKGFSKPLKTHKSEVSKAGSAVPQLPVHSHTSEFIKLGMKSF